MILKNISESLCRASILVLSLSICVIVFLPAASEANDSISQMIDMNNHGRYSEVVDMGERLLVKLPKDERLHFNQARALAGLYRMDEARTEYELCRTSAPRSELGIAAQEQIAKIDKKYPRGQSTVGANGNSGAVPVSRPAAVPNVRNYVNYGTDSPAPYIPATPDLKARAKSISPVPLRKEQTLLPEGSSGRAPHQ
jgi:hypothetical protein